MTTEVERNILEQEADDLINMLEKMDLSPEPGDIQKGTVLGKTAENHAMPTTVQNVVSAGWVTLYHVLTGEPSLVSRNNLRYLTRPDWLLPDGRPAFHWEQKVKPVLGTLLCLLHVQHPQRKEYDAMGLQNRICTRDGLFTRMDVIIHMQHRHKAEWALINEIQEERRREEVLQAQRDLAAAMLASAQGRPVAAVAEPVPTLPVERVASLVSDKVFRVPCEHEGCDFVAESIGHHLPAHTKLRNHVKEAHPDG